MNIEVNTMEFTISFKAAMVYTLRGHFSAILEQIGINKTALILSTLNVERKTLHTWVGPTDSCFSNGELLQNLSR